MCRAWNRTYRRPAVNEAKSAVGHGKEPFPDLPFTGRQPNRFGFSEAKSLFLGLDSWIRRRLRCYLWKQWGQAGYRRLVERGVTRDLAWFTAKSAHGPWRISQSPALLFALPKKYSTGSEPPLFYDKKTVD